MVTDMTATETRSFAKLEARFSKMEARLSSILTENKLLRSENKKLSKQNAALLVQNQELLDKNQALELKVLSLQRQVFGKKKDKLSSTKNNSNNSNVVHYLRKNKRLPKALSKARGRRKLPNDYTPDETRRYDFTNNPSCDCCKESMSYLSSNNSHHTEYEVILKKVKIVQEKYVCSSCSLIKVATGSKLPIPKGLPLAGMLTKVILDKFGNAMPFYRQAQNFNYSGQDYNRQLLNSWFARGANLIEPVVKLLYSEMLKSDYLMCDETGLLLLHKENNKEGKVHLCVLKEGGKKFNFVYCWPIMSRTQEEINTKLKDFSGHFQTDGLNFYFEVHEKDGIIAVNCWAHVRRKFVDIALLAKNKGGIALKVVKLIDKLYKIEQKGKKLNPEKLLKLRKNKSTPILKQLKDYLLENKALVPPKSQLGVAINYTLDRWDALISYLSDSKIEIDNNSTERCIKYCVIGRKNWLFADNMDSAEKLGMLYSLIISCKINNINPKAYLEYVFTQMPYINKHDIEQLKQLLPDRFSLNKRFDEEYRQSRGITEEIISHRDIEIAEELQEAA